MAYRNSLSSILELLAFGCLQRKIVRDATTLLIDCHRL
jgi:hypothetical protein